MCDYSEKHNRSLQFDEVREQNNTSVIVGTSCSLAETEEKSDWPNSKFPIDFLRFMAPSLNTCITM